MSTSSMRRLCAPLEAATSLSKADTSDAVRDGRVMLPATPTTELDVRKIALRPRRIKIQTPDIVYRNDRLIFRAKASSSFVIVGVTERNLLFDQKIGREPAADGPWKFAGRIENRFSKIIGIIRLVLLFGRHRKKLLQKPGDATK
jgi:hypothetical protein